MLLSLDAVVRTLVRRLVTRRRLLEWETAAETELSTRKQTPVDIYLEWMPALALGLGVWSSSPGATLFMPHFRSLLLWGCSKWISMWLNLPSRSTQNDTSGKDELFLSGAALRTWRYFAEFSTAEHNWLIPDNVQEEPAAVAGRMSPTNLGFLLNARQVACEFGFLTVPEFAEQTLRTLATVAKLPRSHGHLLNWYDTRTLQPLQPAVCFFGGQREPGGITVDPAAGMSRSVASSAAGAATGGRIDGSSPHSGRAARFPAEAFQGISDPDEEEKLACRACLRLQKKGCWRSILPKGDSKHEAEVRWFAAESLSRLRNLRKAVQVYVPWMLPEFVPLWNDSTLNFKFDSRSLTVERLPEIVDALNDRLQFALTTPMVREIARPCINGCRLCCRKRVHGHWI